jgi:hypothetical protein
MSATFSAIIAAAAAVVGGLLTAFATRSVERLRLRAALLEKANERRLSSIEEFMLAVHAWLDWLIYIEEFGWQGKADELNQRVKRRDEAYRRLLLLSSEALFRWLTEKYGPAEYEVRQEYVHWLRHRSPDGSANPEAIKVRQAFDKLLREDLVEIARPEVGGLRNPTDLRRR